MRVLVLFHAWNDETDATIDPLAVVPEAVVDNLDDQGLDTVFHAAKVVYGVVDAPSETFRTAWLTISGEAVQRLFETPDLGAATLTPIGDPVDKDA